MTKAFGRSVVFWMVILTAMTPSSIRAVTNYADNAYGDIHFDGSTNVVVIAAPFAAQGPKRYIADAIDIAGNGDFVFAEAGSYKEAIWNLDSKDVTLSPQGQVTIQDTDTPQTDTDFDGIPDWWMLKYFGHATGEPSDLSRTFDDADNDLVSNYEEFQQMTNPLDPSSHPSLAPVYHEWYGPFPSWTNVMDFGAVGDGTTDDTAAISNALASVGIGLCSPVLYFPSGHVYRVTQKLWLRNRQNVEIVGLDRDTTVLIYDGVIDTDTNYSGPSTLFHLDGV